MGGCLGPRGRRWGHDLPDRGKAAAGASAANVGPRQAPRRSLALARVGHIHPGKLQPTRRVALAGGSRAVSRPTAFVRCHASTSSSLRPRAFAMASTLDSSILRPYSTSLTALAFGRPASFATASYVSPYCFSSPTQLGGNSGTRELPLLLRRRKLPHNLFTDLGVSDLLLCGQRTADSRQFALRHIVRSSMSRFGNFIGRHRQNRVLVNPLENHQQPLRMGFTAYTGPTWSAGTADAGRRSGV